MWCVRLLKLQVLRYATFGPFHRWGSQSSRTRDIHTSIHSCSREHSVLERGFEIGDFGSREIESSASQAIGF